MATIILPPGSTSADLQTALDTATFGDIIELSSDMPFSGTVTIREGLEVTIQSPAENKWTLLQFTPNTRHFEINGSLILENITVDGRGTSGGVQLNRGAFCLQHDAVVENCHAENGGGVEVIAGVFSIYDGDVDKPFPLKGGEVRNNTATNGGGVYLHAGLFNVSCGSGFIQNNTATENGGGVFVAGGTFRLTGGEILNNQAQNGAGLYVNAGTLSMNRGNFVGNIATMNGGGIYVSETGVLEMVGNVISVASNTALNGGGIFTAHPDLANVTTGNNVVFRCNKASAAYAPPEDAGTLYPDMQFAETTIMEHVLNNYDVNYSEGAPVNVANNLSYNANGGIGGHIGPDIGPCETDVVLSVEDTSIRRKGYTFISWNTEPDGSGTSYMPGDEITLSGDMVLYAQWEPIERPSCWIFCEKFRKEFCKMFCEELCCETFLECKERCRCRKDPCGREDRCSCRRPFECEEICRRKNCGCEEKCRRRIEIMTRKICQKICGGRAYDNAEEE